MHVMRVLNIQENIKDRRKEMKITDVRIRKINEQGKLKAVASITFDDEFAVHDIKIIEGNKGRFVAMPSRNTYDKYSGEEEFRDIAHPIKQETREKIQKAILDKYMECAE